MAESEKKFNQLQYQNEFIREKYDRIGLVVPKGEKQVVKAKATAAGESVNEYISKAIKMRMASEE